MYIAVPIMQIFREHVFLTFFLASGESNWATDVD